ncbi:MAG: hypothetical protein K6E37_06640 [Bacteroidales bacterium]|nr:hypothetical protein [Bacteroidales bacterium]
MKRQEPDYRKLTDVQLKYELKKLEAAILEQTTDPLASKVPMPFYEWSRNKTAVEELHDKMLTRSCILNILFERHCTPAEVARLEKVNELLLDMTNRTYRRTVQLYRTVLTMPKDEYDDDFEIEARFAPLYDIPSSVLRLSDDSYYGSDFIRMAAILQETEEFESGMADVACYWSMHTDHTPDMTDAELGCANTLDDGQTWAEAWLRIPQLEHITVCYALHALVTHQCYSIPDVLRINDYKIEVNLKVQQFSDQNRNRLWWWDKYDLPRFKEALFQEADARPEGLPLDTFILQRARDYFGERADEVLAAVGISDIDRYIATLKQTIANPSHI